MSSDVKTDAKPRKERGKLSTQRLLTDLQKYLPTDGSMGYLPIEKLAKRYKVHRQTLWRHLSELKASGDIELVTGQKRGNKIRTEAKLLKKSEQKPKCHETAPQAAAHIKNVTTVNTWVCGGVVVALSQTALQARSVWVCWRYGEMRSAKQGKVPYNPKSSHYAHALPNDSSTWATYEQARARFL